MAELVCLADFRYPQESVSFDREELSQLLALYARRVARGEWRDYAIDHGAGMAVFTVFRHADTRPLFAIAKIADGPEAKGGYLLFNGSRVLRNGRRLGDVLAAFDTELKLVVSRG